jgi:hypothetical protein
MLPANGSPRTGRSVPSARPRPTPDGAALSYARRYALFALVGIAGEDDLDAPDLITDPSPTPREAPDRRFSPQNGGKPANGSLHRSGLAAEPSATLRDQLVAEICDLKSDEDLALWARRGLPAKNSLTADDARAVEAAYLTKLDATSQDAPNPDRVHSFQPLPKGSADETSSGGQQSSTTEMVSPIRKTIRRRSKAHRAYVSAQPCLICRRSPGDAHHLKFAQPATLGRKVSDEFTVPLCRNHHHALHRNGNEISWWTNFKIAPLEIAKELWSTSPIHGLSAAAIHQANEIRRLK